jgi:hypothetical protein
MFGEDGKGWCEPLKEEGSRRLAARYCCILILTAQKGNVIPRLIRVSLVQGIVIQHLYPCYVVVGFIMTTFRIDYYLGL